MTVRLGLRLALAGGREPLLRFGFTAVGVALGLTLLLLALTAPSAAKGRAERAAWQGAAYAVAYPEGDGPPAAESADGALFIAVSDYYDGEPMTRAYVAALGADPPVPPGLDRLPGPGEVAVSPAMRDLLAATDDADGRFPGAVTMTIGPDGLAHANERVAVIGRTPDQLRGVRSVEEVRGFALDAPVLALVAPFLMLVGAVVVLAPTVILIVSVTRLAAAQRERRLAAIRLVGATRRQIAVVAATETGSAAAAGALLAWPAYEVGRRILAATVSFQGGPFWVEDAAVPPVPLALILLAAPVFVVLTTIVSLRGVQTRPLGISRRVRRAPSAGLALPLPVGLAGLFLLPALRDSVGPDASGQLAALFAFLTLIGLVLIGPWLCVAISRGIVRVARRVPALLAARRIAADPWATFRAVSGVVLAATAVTYIGTTVPYVTAPNPTETAVAGLRPGAVQVYTGGVPATTVAALLPGATVTTRLSPAGLLAPCAELARVRYASCPYPPPDESFMREPGPGAESLPVYDLFFLTDGSLAAENRIRNEAAAVVPNAIVNSDRDPVDRNLETLLVDLDRLAGIAALFVLLVGACGLVAGTIGGLVERRRSFALLHASGVRLGELRRVVFLETAATMLVTSVVGVGLGLLLAFASTRQGGLGWTWPDPLIFAYLGAGVLAALALATLALPLINAATRHDAIRYE